MYCEILKLVDMWCTQLCVDISVCDEYSEVLKLLLQCEAQATLIDENGNSALHLAAWGGHVTECHTLLHYSPTLLDSQVSWSHGH